MQGPTGRIVADFDHLDLVPLYSCKLCIMRKLTNIKNTKTMNLVNMSTERIKFFIRPSKTCFFFNFKNKERVLTFFSLSFVICVTKATESTLLVFRIVRDSQSKTRKSTTAARPENVFHRHRCHHHPVLSLRRRTSLQHEVRLQFFSILGPISR